MEQPEQRIAKVDGTFIGFEDHGLLSASVHFDFGGSAQGIGHRIFGSASEEDGDFDKWRIGHEMGMDFIRRVLLACGVDRWEQLKGRTVFVTATWSDIKRIGPLPTEKGVSFDIETWAQSYDALLT